MTVAELIEKLKEMPRDALVYVRETSSPFLESPTPQLLPTAADGYCIARDNITSPIYGEPAVIL